MPEAMFNLKSLDIMANYSENQVRHLFVAKDYVAAESIGSGVTGAIALPSVINEGGQKFMYFLYKGPKGIVKSDYIPLKNLDSVRVIKASDQALKMRKVKVLINDTPVNGQDYVLGINFKNFFSSGDASQYYKNVAVHVTSAINTKALFAAAVVDALNKAFSREDGATPTSNPYLAFSVSGNYIVIEEKAQEWELGTKKARRIMFDVIPGTILSDGDDIIWGTITEDTPTTTIGNGQRIADLEWACMGNRGDQYRNVGWPHVIKTEYITDPTKEYSLIELHYAFTDTGVNSYRTEKELTIAVENGTGGSKYTDVNALLNAIEAATGLTIADDLAD